MECVLFGLDHDGVNGPELRLGQTCDLRKVKVHTEAGGLAWCEFLHQFIYVDVHVAGCVEDLVDHGLNDESDVGLIRVVLEHMNGRLHGSLHRGNHHILDVQSLYLKSVCFRLCNTDRFVELWVDSGWVSHECRELCRVLSELVLTLLCPIVKHGQAVAYEVELCSF